VPAITLLDACELERSRAIRAARTFAVVMVDLDASALAISRAARRLRAQVRTFDTVVVDRRRKRVAVVLPEVRASELPRVCDRLRATLAADDAACAAALYPSDGATAVALVATCEDRLERGGDHARLALDQAPVTLLETSAR
jgi:GGDEF domain-containing protein